MKRHSCYLLLFFLLSNLYTYSQALDKFLNVKYKNGFAILCKGDTLEGKFEFNDCEQNYKLLVYLNPDGKGKKAYEPQEVKYFALEDVFYLPKQLDEGWEFVQLISNDNLAVYLRKRFITTNTGAGTVNQIMYQKSNGKYLLVSFDPFFLFKPRLTEFFSDDQELCKKINNDTYTKKDVLKIALEYNNWLKQQK